jgi:ribosomal protein L16 Arg81 hydroxylase
MDPIGLKALFHSVSPKTFLESYFPLTPLLEHGARDRFGELGKELILCDPTKFIQAIDGNAADVIVKDIALVPAASPKKWVDMLARELGLTDNQITCSVIYTPKGRGTNKHFDGVEGLTIQLCGKKRWRFEPSREFPLPNQFGVDTSATSMRSGSRQFTLKTGSVSFLPRGWWHDTFAVETAISLHFELRSDNWFSALWTVMGRQLLASPEWRAPISKATPRQRKIAQTNWPKLQKQLIDIARHLQSEDLI